MTTCAKRAGARPFVSVISHDLRAHRHSSFVDTMLMAMNDGMPFDEETTRVPHDHQHNSPMLRLVNDILVLAPHQGHVAGTVAAPRQT